MLLQLTSLCIIEKMFPKDILCHSYSTPHLVIHFANLVITTLREIIFKGTKFRGMFICCIKLSHKYRRKKVRSSSKNLVKMFFFAGINFRE